MRKISSVTQYPRYLELARGFRNTAKGILESGEELEPVAFAVKTKESGQDEVAAIPLSALPSKDAVKPFLSMVVKQHKIDAIILIIDSYVSTGDEQTQKALLNEYQEVRHVPGRRECILTLLETRDGIVHTIFNYYIRDESGKVIWQEEEENYSDEDVGKNWSGRMFGFFPRG